MIINTQEKLYNNYRMFRRIFYTIDQPSDWDAMALIAIDICYDPLKLISISYCICFLMLCILDTTLDNPVDKRPCNLIKTNTSNEF